MGVSDTPFCEKCACSECVAVVKSCDSDSDLAPVLDTELANTCSAGAPQSRKPDPLTLQHFSSFRKNSQREVLPTAYTRLNPA